MVRSAKAFLSSRPLQFRLHKAYDQDDNKHVLRVWTQLPHQLTEILPSLGNYINHQISHGDIIVTTKTNLESKENEYQRNHRSYTSTRQPNYHKERTHDGRTTIQSRTGYVIKLTPPRKVLLPNKILEDERYREPRRVVDARRGWHRWHPSEDDRSADELDPRVRVTALPEPEWKREEHTRYHGV